MAIVNGVAYDFTTLSSSMYNLDISQGLLSISYGQQLESEQIQGTAAEPYASTPGAVKADDAELELEEFAANALRAKIGAGYMRKWWPAACTYKMEGEEAITDTFSARIKGEKKNPKRGSESCKVTFTLEVLKLRMAGISPV